MNKAFFKVHSILALVTFLPLLLICITGSILVFKHEIDWLLMADKVRIEQQGERLQLDRLLRRINDAYPNYEVVGWVKYPDAGRADQVYVMAKGSSEWSFLHLNPYTGVLLSEPHLHDHYLTDWLLELHYTFLLHDAGLVITGLLALGLLILGITGLFLHRKFWKNFFTLRRKSRLVVYFSDLHKMVGIISSPILIILAFTGLWWNVTSVLHEIEEHSDGQEHHIMQERLYSDSISLDAMLGESQKLIAGFRANYIGFPYEPGLDFILWGDAPTGNFLASQYGSTVSFDATSGEVTSANDIRAAGLGAKIVDSYQPLHFGDFAGLVSRVVWAVIGLMPLLLSITGLTLWWKRRDKRQNSRMKKRRMIQTDKVILD